MIFFLYMLKKSEIDQLNMKITCKNQDRLTIGLISTEKSTRIRIMMDLWVNEAVELGYDILILSKPQNSIPNFRFLPPNQTYIKAAPKGVSKSDIDRAAKRITAAEYLIPETDNEWLWVATDDVFVFLPDLEKMMHTLSKRYNARTDKVLLGNCIAPSWMSIVFLQGGIGHVISRKTALLMKEKGIKWIQRLGNYDDMSFNRMLKILELNVSQCGSEFLSGSQIQDYVFPGFEKKLEECNNSFYYPKCQQPLYPFSSLVGIHDTEFEKQVHVFEILQKIKQDQELYWYPLDGWPKFGPKLCRKNQMMFNKLVFIRFLICCECISMKKLQYSVISFI